MTPTDSIRDWFGDAADLAARRARSAPIKEGAELFGNRVRSAPALPFAPRSLAVLRAAHTVDDTPLGERFASLAQHLPWSMSPRWDDGGRERGLCVVGDMFELDDVAAGLVYLDGGGRYPEHWHRPQELYLTVAGAGRWRFGGATDFVEVAPGSTLYNHPNDRHAIVAGPTPLVAMYVLWGDGI
ncbi:MAG: dimethylsulfonioproprionate lyase family protein [Actinomycetota bacterium]|jgi:quercetin dioxygenase-like cupin family protein|nr:dimethylsulfonioproprionate lyase family protein [Actinomycetota bacterium]